MTLDTYRKSIFLVIIFLSFMLYTPLLAEGLDRLAVGRFIGLFGLQLIWWQVILGNRQLTRFITQDLLWINRVHRFVGTYGFLIIILHPLIMISIYDLVLVWPPSFASPFDIGVRFGTLALSFLAFVWFISALLRSKLGWRWWKRLHLLAYLIFPLLSIHMLLVGSSRQQFSWLGIWLYFVITAFVIVVLLRIAGWAGLTKFRYSVIKTSEVAKNVTRFRLAPLDRVVVPQPGQFAYLQGKRYGESHPFTVSHFDDMSNEISFSIKAVGPYSRWLTALQPGDTVFVDGPYGTFTKEIGHSDRPVVAIVGGIGITPFIRHLEQETIDYLFWGCQTEADIAYKDTVEASGAKICYVLSKETEQKPGYEIGTIDVELLESKLSQPLSKYIFYLCGPPPMMKSLQKQLLDHGVKSAQVYQEKFSL